MKRLPSIFLSHGAPSYALDPGLAGQQLITLGQQLPTPKAILVVSPHWMTSQPKVATSIQPETIHDFGGFAPALYQLQYPAPGHPQLAMRAIELLRAAGWQADSDNSRGLDHGAWVPLRFLFPAVDVPVFQVSLPGNLSSSTALNYGAALAPLADEGVLIIGSGSLTHNLYEVRGGHEHEAAYAQEFTAWIRHAVELGDRQALVNALELAPHAKRAHPTTEHFLPLLVALGAAASSLPATVLPGGITHGVLSMESYVFGQSITLSVAASEDKKALAI
ncbi:MAG: class III extradiol ring-cleavage dioxygenase [Pseudomonadota bacterium]